MMENWILTTTTVVMMILVATAANQVSASVYEINYRVDVADWQGPTSEGPMYALKDFPGISSGTPYVRFVGESHLAENNKAFRGNLSIVFTHSPTRIQPNSSYPEPCSEDDPLMLSEEILATFGELTQVLSYELIGGEKKEIDAKAALVASGFQYVTFILCTEDDSPAEVNGLLKFRNPYGYLPALLYGFLPFSGLLAVAYFILGAVYTILAIRHRESLLKIQVCILFVIIMGFIETTTWFFTYEVMNETGEPSCCPVRKDIVFAIGVNNLKRVVSALLILCVSIGWGVAKPSLEIRTTLKIAILGLLYLAFSLNYDMRRIWASSENIPEDTQMHWALPVAICDVIFVFWIYFAIGTVQEELEKGGQQAKLEMYQKLSRTLAFWVVIWVLYTFFSIFVNNKIFELSWKLMFAMFGFWDVLYFGILVSISRIWAPSRSSLDYAYSHQIPTNEVLDEFDNNALEMNAPSSMGNGKSSQVAHAADDDDDVEVDIGLEKSPKKTPKVSKD